MFRDLEINQTSSKSIEIFFDVGIAWQASVRPLETSLSDNTLFMDIFADPFVIFPTHDEHTPP